MLSLKKLSFATIALAALTALAGTAQANQEVHIQNLTEETIYVGVRFLPPVGHVYMHGWWELEPGETRKIVNIVNYSNIYFYAYSVDSDSMWTGSDYFDVTGELLPFFKQSTGHERMFIQRFAY